MVEKSDKNAGQEFYLDDDVDEDEDGIPADELEAIDAMLM